MLQTWIEEWSEDLESLRQNRLLDESSFIDFARDRGLPVHGEVEKVLGSLRENGLLTTDGIDYDGGPLFHPFRIYPLLKTLGRQRTAPPEIAGRWNEIVDLTILLEPVFWPVAVGRYSCGCSEVEFYPLHDTYRERMAALIRTLDSSVWRKNHELLRTDAAWMDENTDLYVLLRLSMWEQREKLKGPISGALWIRHLAEVIRRGFEVVNAEVWPEEDRIGHWPPGARRHAFGSERLLDDELRSKPYLANQFGLFTGSAARWYVEGDTEYGAILCMLQDPWVYGVDLVNLQGNIKSEKGNIALKLGDALKADRNLRRFSLITFDDDVAENKKAIRLQIEQGNVVGSITANKPDFEFANFTIQELAEIAASMDETEGFAGGVVRCADWTGITNAKAFEDRYKRISERKRPLKGKQWGESLAKYAKEHPRRSDDDRKRPLVHDVWAASVGWNLEYDFQKDNFTFDPTTFEPISRKA